MMYLKKATIFTFIICSVLHINTTFAKLNTKEKYINGTFYGEYFNFIKKIQKFQNKNQFILNLDFDFIMIVDEYPLEFQTQKIFQEYVLYFDTRKTINLGYYPGWECRNTNINNQNTLVIIHISLLNNIYKIKKSVSDLSWLETFNKCVQKYIEINNINILKLNNY